MKSYVERHPPLIASRIEFSFASPPPLPSISQRINFGGGRLTHPDDIGGGEGGGNDGGNDVDRDPTRTPTTPRTRSKKIHKPAGEPGRPGSGGYCTETILTKSHNWSKEMVIEVTVCAWSLWFQLLYWVLFRMLCAQKPARGLIHQSVIGVRIRRPSRPFVTRYMSAHNTQI